MPWLVLEKLLRPVSSHGLTLWHPLHFCVAHFDLISLGSKCEGGRGPESPPGGPMDFHWIIGQEGERKKGPPCRAPMIGHYSDFVSRISRSPKQLPLLRVSGHTDLLLLEVFSGDRKEA